MPTRFQLDDTAIHAFGDEFLVACPRCSQRALVRDRGPEAEAPRIVLTCGACGYSRRFEGDLWSTTYGRNAAYYEPGQRSIGDAVDWYFHRPLWLQILCCGENLWAYNLRHLAFLEDFVQATLRENVKSEHGWSNQILRNRLPAWIKDAHNRGDILKCIAKLRRKATA